MVRKTFFAIALIIGLQSILQAQDFYDRSGLLKANLTFNQGFMLFHKAPNVYLGGNFEYFPDQNISIRGDCFWYLDSRRENPVLKQSTLVFFGALFHLPKGKSDFYTGIQPGFAFTRPALLSSTDQSYPLRMMPSLALSLGYSFYFSRFCNFFVGVNYFVLRYRGAGNGSLKLDELMISGGLGFHLSTKKQKPAN
ncbi:MAG: hypothetical protein KAZ36_05350 [Bacteroidales bacterium]|nr:hypothetical protein [Bacteroidales bacterium]